MSERIFRSNRFETELFELFQYFVKNASCEVADRFADKVEELIHSIAEFPDMGSLLETSKKRPPVRVRMVPDFPKYLVAYRRIEDGIMITRVLHAMRNLDDLI